MKQKRPVNLDLTTLRFPPMAIASILHRISGIVLFLLFPVMLYFLALSLRSPSDFQSLTELFMSPYCKALLWVFSAAITYHMLAGFRHVIMDMGFGEGLAAGRRSAVVVITLAILLTILTGIWIW